MAIVYYPNRTLKRLDPSIDRVMAKRNVRIVQGAKNITSAGLDVVISANSDWQVNNVTLNFSAATARDYGWSIINGRKVVTDANDYLWFQMSDTLWTKITLDPGFYTGTQLAAELQDKLDAAFTPITFTVAYDAATGLFTVTPSSGTMRYIDYNTAQTLPNRQSIGGHLFGWTDDTAFGATVVSDTPVFGLNMSSDLVDETASTVTQHFNDDLHILNIDQALRITTGTAGIRVDYAVTYEEIV